MLNARLCKYAGETSVFFCKTFNSNRNEMDGDHRYNAFQGFLNSSILGSSSGEDDDANQSKCLDTWARHSRTLKTFI